MFNYKKCLYIKIRRKKKKKEKKKKKKEKKRRRRKRKKERKKESSKPRTVRLAPYLAKTDVKLKQTEKGIKTKTTKLVCVRKLPH